MKEIDLMYRTMLSELAQRSLDAAFKTDFSVDGRFVPVTVKDRVYWYFDHPTADRKKQNRRYVGPRDDPEITARVEAFQQIKDDLKARRKLVATLTRDAGMASPDRVAGDIVEALSHAGLFRLRAVLIGTVAFQTYAGVLGVRLPSTSMQTGDADFAQDFAISAEVKDSLPPILEILQAVDTTFRAVPHRSGSHRSTAFENATRYRVEFLTTNRGSDDHQDKPADMPALGGAAADPMRFLDFLISDPIRTVLLHRGGFPVIVPAPERYAVHKLIVATRRQKDFTMKAEKDIAQAGLLIEALHQTGRSDALAIAYGEAMERGTAWSDAIDQGQKMLPVKPMTILRQVLG